MGGGGGGKGGKEGEKSAVIDVEYSNLLATQRWEKKGGGSVSTGGQEIWVPVAMTFPLFVREKKGKVKCRPGSTKTP